MADMGDDLVDDDMMEAVMMYSCKRCSYMTKTPADLRKHIQQVHNQKIIARVATDHQGSTTVSEGPISVPSSTPVDTQSESVSIAEPYPYPVSQNRPPTPVYKSEMDSAVSSIPVEETESVISVVNDNIVEENNLSIIPVTIRADHSPVIHLGNQFNSIPPGYTSLLGSSQLQKVDPLSAYSQNEVTSQSQKAVPVSAHSADSQRQTVVSLSTYPRNQLTSQTLDVASLSTYPLDHSNSETQKVVPLSTYTQNQAGAQTQKVVPIQSIPEAETSQVIAVTCEEQILDENIRILSDSKEQFRNIQFVNQDEQGQIILQESENVEFGEGATIQVLVHDPDIEEQVEPGLQKDETRVEGVEYESDDKKIAMEVQTGEVRERRMVAGNLHYIIQDVDDGYCDENSEAMMEVGVGTSDGAGEMNAEQQAGYMTVTTMTDGENKVSAHTMEQVVENKEMYVCGSCRRGYTSMAACQAHIVRDHNLQQGPTVTEVASNRIDVGTQMEPRKRVGRKRKSEVEAERLAAVKKENVEEELIMSDSDEDWTENFEMCTYSSRSKRRRQPPSSLQKDYYLGKSRLKVIKKHAETGHNVRCDIRGCTARFREEATMREHLECHINMGNSKLPQFRCTSCEETFSHWKQTRYHLWKSHHIDYNLFNCEICNNFKTDTMSKLKIHQEIHSSERRYACSVCGKGYKQFAQMKNHEVLHMDHESVDVKSPDLAGRWHTPKTCDICSRVFANAKCLKKHKDDVHSGNKPFACRYCKHKCSRKAMMVLHERIHTGDKPFKCDQCQYSCGDHNSLRRHKMRHSGQKPYKCEHCGYACIQAISLKVHMKKKHPGVVSEGVFCCALCKYRTVNKQQFQNHQMDHKNGLIETVTVAADQDENKARVVKNVKQGTVKPNRLLYDIMALFQAPGQSSAPSQIIQIPVSTVNGTEQYTQLEVQMNESGAQVISVDDLNKLYNYDGLVQTDAQLLYSALSAISQDSPQQTVEVGTQPIEVGTQLVEVGTQPVEIDAQSVPDYENSDIQTSIETNTKGGVTTITLHLPDGEELGGEVILQEKQQSSEEVNSEEHEINWQAGTTAVVQDGIEQQSSVIVENEESVVS